jgi:hypothetical protein
MNEEQQEQFVYGVNEDGGICCPVVSAYGLAYVETFHDFTWAFDDIAHSLADNQSDKKPTHPGAYGTISREKTKEAMKAIVNAEEIYGEKTVNRTVKIASKLGFEDVVNEHEESNSD